MGKRRQARKKKKAAKKAARKEKRAVKKTARKEKRAVKKTVRKDKRAEKRQDRRGKKLDRQENRADKRENRQQRRRDNQDKRRGKRVERRGDRREKRSERQAGRRENRDERRENRQEWIDDKLGQSDRRDARRDKRDGRRDNRRGRQDDRREKRKGRRGDRQTRRGDRRDSHRARQDARRLRRDNRRESRRPMTAEYWLTPAPGHDFPEEELEEVMAKPNIGICFSGGGSRSAVASFGIYRALREMGLDNQLRYVSANSGGAWFVAANSFLPEEMSDSEFFGDYLDFESISNFDDVRSNVESSSFLRALTYGGIGRKALHGFKGYVKNRDENWSRALGQSILAPLGISESMHPVDSKLNAGSENQRRGFDHIKWFTWSEETLDDILKDNPQFEDDDFDIVNRDRPFPIIVGALHSGGRYKTRSGDTGFTMTLNEDEFLAHYSNVEWDEDTKETKEDLESEGVNLEYLNMSLLEMTPMYTGVRMESEERGGFYVESFAIDSELKEVLSDNELVLDARVLSRNNDGISQRFSVCDMMGITGSAMGWLSQGIPGTHFLKKIEQRSEGKWDPSIVEDWTSPAIVHWQPQKHPQDRVIKRKENVVSRAVDGGFMDNLGLMPLLMRQVPQIILCVNSDYSIHEHEMLPSPYEHLFGVIDRTKGSTAYASRGRNQVFSNENGEADALLEHLEQNRENRDVTFHRGIYQVVENQNYGIEPYEVELFWYFTETSQVSEDTIAVLEDDYSNIEGYTASVDDYDLSSIILKDLLGAAFASLTGTGLGKGVGHKTARAVNGIADSFSTSQIAANSIFDEDWEHIAWETLAANSSDDVTISAISDMLENSGFPHYNTHIRLSLSAEEVGLLANYTHWSFLQIEEELNAFFQGVPIGPKKVKKSERLMNPLRKKAKKSDLISSKRTLQRRELRDEEDIERDERIEMRREDRIEDREYFGDADVDLNEDNAFVGDEELHSSTDLTLLGRQQWGTASKDIPSGFSRLQDDSSFTLKDATAGVEYEVDISHMADDPDEGDVISFSKIEGPDWLQVDEEGHVSGTPSSSDIGLNRFTLRVTDLEGESADAEITIDVETGNRPPRWKADLRD